MTPQKRNFISVLVIATIPFLTFIVTSSPSSLSSTPARAQSPESILAKKKIGRGERHQNFVLKSVLVSNCAHNVKRWAAGLWFRESHLPAFLPGKANPRATLVTSSAQSSSTRRYNIHHTWGTFGSSYLALEQESPAPNSGIVVGKVEDRASECQRYIGQIGILKHKHN